MGIHPAVGVQHVAGAFRARTPRGTDFGLIARRGGKIVSRRFFLETIWRRCGIGVECSVVSVTDRQHDEGDHGVSRARASLRLVRIEL